MRQTITDKKVFSTELKTNPWLVAAPTNNEKANEWQSKKNGL